MAIFLTGSRARYGRIVASTTYVPQIDGLRFVAIIQVMLYHAALRGQRNFAPGLPIDTGYASWLPNGAAGVELFFFISGYIISYPFLAGRAPSLRAFYLRRLLRLEPPYMLVLLGSFLFLAITNYHPAEAGGFNKSSMPLWQSFLASVVYCHGLIFSAPPRLNPPLWSLELEIQFYLIAPFLLMAYRRMPRFARVLAGAGLILAMLVAQAILSGSESVLNFTILTRGTAFVLGILFCDRAIARDPLSLPPKRIFDAVFALGLILLIVSGSLFYPSSASRMLSLATLAMRGAAIVMLYAGAMRGTAARRVLAMPWLTLIGGACYSLYLVHVPLMQLIAKPILPLVHAQSLTQAWILALLLLPPALVAGLVYYLLIERPCMRKDWPQRLASGLVRATTRLRGGRGGPVPH